MASPSNFFTVGVAAAVAARNAITMKSLIAFVGITSVDLNVRWRNDESSSGQSSFIPSTTDATPSYQNN